MDNSKHNFSNSTKQDLVVALHCSGGNPNQWHALSTALSSGYHLETPAHMDSSELTAGTCGLEFTLSTEAAHSVQLIDQFDGDVHLVGHSCGSGVALKVAMARPERVASITLYEPCVFHILPQ